MEYITVDNFKLLNLSQTLPNYGIYQFDEYSSYSYLKINDDYIYKLYPLLQEENIRLPDYFSANNQTGAHISIAYPNEIGSHYIKNDIQKKKITGQAIFEITGLIQAKLNNKIFFALSVSSKDLTQIRKRYDLPPLLCYKTIHIPFHITIAVADPAFSH